MSQYGVEFRTVKVNPNGGIIPLKGAGEKVEEVVWHNSELVTVVLSSLVAINVTATEIQFDDPAADFFETLGPDAFGGNVATDGSEEE